MKTVTTRHSADKTREVPTKWAGKALAVHRPVIGFGTELSKKPCSWTITHIESGLSAGQFNGSMHDAVKLAKAWDLVFMEELRGTEPNATVWPRREQWLRQLRGEEAIKPPTSLEALVAEYA